MTLYVVLTLCSLANGSCETLRRPVPTAQACETYRRVTLEALRVHGVERTHSIELECLELPSP